MVSFYFVQEKNAAFNDGEGSEFLMTSYEGKYIEEALQEIFGEACAVHAAFFDGEYNAFAVLSGRFTEHALPVDLKCFGREHKGAKREVPFVVRGGHAEQA